jgi:hypothetical protein
MSQICPICGGKTAFTMEEIGQSTLTEKLCLIHSGKEWIPMINVLAKQLEIARDGIHKAIGYGNRMDIYKVLNATLAALDNTNNLGDITKNDGEESGMNLTNGKENVKEKK